MNTIIWTWISQQALLLKQVNTLTVSDLRIDAEDLRKVTLEISRDL